MPMENLCGMDRLLEIVPQAVTLIKELAEKWMERQEAQSVQEEEDWGRGRPPIRIIPLIPNNPRFLRIKKRVKPPRFGANFMGS